MHAPHHCLSDDCRGIALLSRSLLGKLGALGALSFWAGEALLEGFSHRTGPQCLEEAAGSLQGKGLQGMPCPRGVPLQGY